MKLFNYSEIFFFQKEIAVSDSDSLLDSDFILLDMEKFIKTEFFNEVYRNEYETRFKKGNICCGLLKDERLVNVSWLAKESFFINEIGKEYKIPHTSILIFDVITLESERGKGFYPLMLNHICKWSAANNFNRCIIYTEKGNIASIKGIVRAGFIKTSRMTSLRLAEKIIYFSNKKYD